MDVGEVPRLTELAAAALTPERRRELDRRDLAVNLELMEAEQETARQLRDDGGSAELAAARGVVDQLNRRRMYEDERGEEWWTEDYEAWLEDHLLFWREMRQEDDEIDEANGVLYERAPRNYA